ncbi:unnamed protein product [Caenorhabditis bovis]|uniref:Protein SON n=1 Tax=Caenorhabditis bovis TaxID=2654633 RepID=A0A8S1FDI7_9PELO|nr:unnamed protein product [Caenorhabditis bovis]
MSKSDAIVADLLNEVKGSEQPFIVEKLAAASEPENKEKPHKKSHKHKKSGKKKKKKKSKKEHKSPSRKRRRSRSPKKHRKKRRSSSSSSSSSDSEFDEERERRKNRKAKSSDDVPSDPNQEPNDDDDLPLGADYSTKLLKKDVKMEINIKTVLPECSKSTETVKEEEVDKETKGNCAAKEEEDVKNVWIRKRNFGDFRENPTRSVDIRANAVDLRALPVETRGRGQEIPDDDRRREADDEHHHEADDEASPEIDDVVEVDRMIDDGADQENGEDGADLDGDRGIAKKNRMCAMNSTSDRKGATVDDFVTYCKRIQKRQEREKRREKGEDVSSDESEETIQYKHPYALPKNDPIRINIVTAASASLAQKAITAGEEKELDPTQLHQLFPVSSGAIHKENTEWTPVIKDDVVPMSCTDVQKKHVALTSVEIEKCRVNGLPPPPVPTQFLSSILPPPPPPPKFLPEPAAALAHRPPSPPALPPVLYVPPKEKFIMKDPNDIKFPAPNDIRETLKMRADAQKRLATNPNDFDAHRDLREANEKIEAWAALKSLPGEYTGTTGLKLLTPEQLQPENPKYHAWVKKDLFKNAPPAIGGVGLKLLEKMGWQPGQGLGRDAAGSLEPLTLDVKSDRRGLMAEEEMSIKQRNKLRPETVDLSTKNPVSLLMEYCAKRKFASPSFVCEEHGADNTKSFLWTVTVNNVQYRPLTGSRQKKEGKAIAAQVALMYMNIIPRDPNLVPTSAIL